MLRRIFLILMLSSLAACQTLQGGGMAADKMFDVTFLRENIKPGKTSVEDVRKLFGEPDSKTDGPSGPEYWAYDEYKRNNTAGLMSQAMGALGMGGAASSAAVDAADRQNKGRSLSIHFNRQGTVSNYGISQSRR